MKLRVIAIAAIMLVGTTSAIALVQKPAALQASMEVDALVMQLDASLPRASSLDRAP